MMMSKSMLMLIKPLIPALIMLILFVAAAYAGDIPESLLTEDKSKLFIGEIIEYNTIAGTAIIQPTVRIKGDIDMGTRKKVTIREDYGEVLAASTFMVVNGGPFREGESGLVIEFGNNIDNYLLHISGDDPKTVVLEDIDPDNMWGRLQLYLNGGEYEEAENKRLEKLQSANTTPIEPSNEYKFIFLIIGALLLFIAGVFIRSRYLSR